MASGASKEGGLGGLIFSWNKEVFALLEHQVMQRWMSAIGLLQQNQFRCTLCIVYAPNDQNGRLEVWIQLRLLKVNIEGCYY